MQRTMAWRFAGRLIVAVHRKASPTNVEWQRFLNDSLQAGVNPQWRLLVVSYGGGPDGAQRQQLMQTMRNQVTPMAMMTGSVIVRAIMSALTFFNPTMTVVDLHKDEDAYEFLGLSSAERDTARKLRAELEAELEIETTPSSRPEASPRG
jgi:hypothetical protein